MIFSAVSVLGKLAEMSLKRPKIAIGIVTVVAVLAVGVHYKLVIGERDKLRVAEEGYKAAVAAFIDREATLQEDIRLEREAAQIAVTERDAARLSVEEFRNARQDEESLQWASEQLPIGEIERLCVALPEMAGCG